jgi:predicted nucleic acid-binding protein
MIVLDTDVLSHVMRSDGVAVAWLDEQPRASLWTTAITIFEIRYGLTVMPAGRRHATQLAEFERMIEEDLERRILAFDHAAAEQAAALMGRRRRLGRPVESRDTMIAGIALAQRATLATRNVRQFADLDVPVLDPWRKQLRSSRARRAPRPASAELP